MLFVATCLDKPDSADKRMENRPAHLAYLNGLGARLKIGGALLASDHKTAGRLDDHIRGRQRGRSPRSSRARTRFRWRGSSKASSVKPWRQAVGQSLGMRRRWRTGCSRANLPPGPSSSSTRRRERHRLERRAQPSRQAQHDGDEGRRAGLFLSFQRRQGDRRHRRGHASPIVPTRPTRPASSAWSTSAPSRPLPKPGDARGGQGRKAARQNGAGHQFPPLCSAGDGGGMGDRLQDGRPIWTSPQPRLRKG